MKKKFLNLLFAPLLITPIIVSSCADTNNIAAQTFTYDSNKYQLYIVPVAGDDNSYTTADVLIRLKYTKDPNHKEHTEDNQYIGDITINDSYINKDNGYSYKTNIVSFDISRESYDTKVKYTTNDTYSSYSYVNYYITNFTVNGNSYTTQLEKYYNGKTYFIYVTGTVTMNVNIFKSSSLQGIFDKTSKIYFSSKLNWLKNLWINNNININLPNSLKTIKSDTGLGSFVYSTISQDEFIIPKSVEEIGKESFYNLESSNSDLTSKNNSDKSSEIKKKKIKVPKEFKSQENDIFNDETKKSFEIEHYW